MLPRIRLHSEFAKDPDRARRLECSAVAVSEDRHLGIGSSHEVYFASMAVKAVNSGHKPARWSAREIREFCADSAIGRTAGSF